MQPIQPNAKTEKRTALEIRLFGGFDVRIAGEPMPPLRYRKEQGLLALLVLRHDRDVPRDWLAATFWPDNEESQALFYLRKSLSNLRKALGAEAARLQSPTTRTLRFDLSDAFADVAAFDHAMAGAGSGANSSRESRLQEAVEWYQGALLPNCMDEWIQPERDARAQSFLAALETLANCAIEQGDAVVAVRRLRRLLAADPYREQAACALMQLLSDSGDRAAVNQVYRELRQILRRDLNLSPAPETETLYQQLTRREMLPPVALPVSAETVSLRHLPVPLSDLIGREQDVAAVVGWLRRCRLVTLTGPGGVGKTRLSIAAADAALSDFADGVWFVDLASLTEPDLLPQTVLQVLNLSADDSQPPMETLANALASRSLLLALDNCEHLMDACAALTHSLLMRCSGLRILATSRQALGVTGEQTYPLASLALPPDEETVLAEKDPFALLDYAGVRLFVERAMQANPLFRLNRRNAESIAQICRHLDGIPLALEMGAARMRSLSPQEILTRLGNRFRLLTTGSRAALPRQQTLRAAIDWSHDLLSEAERAVLRRLSVFAGGWTLDSAEQVCLENEVFDLVAGLVDKSLVQRSGEEENARYRLLETVREYAAERLAESGEAETLRRRHSITFLALAEDAVALLGGAEPEQALARLECENDNLRAALEFCGQGTDADTETGMRLAGTLCGFWLARGDFQEGRRWCSFFLAQPAAPARTCARAVLLQGAGSLAQHQRDDAQAWAYAEESFALFEELGDDVGIAEVRQHLAHQLERRDPQQAERFYRESLATWKALAAHSREANTLHSLGQLARNGGHYPAARKLYGESLTLYRALNHRQNMAIVLHSLAYTDFLEQRYDAARASAEEALRLTQATGNRTWELYHLALLGWVCLAQDDAAGIQVYCEASIRLLRHLGLKAHAAGALECLACLAQLQGQAERGACLAGAASAIREALGVRMDAVILPDYTRRIAALEVLLGQPAFMQAWERGSLMTMEQALLFAQTC